jgi:MerR family transcriptional regulator, copper efflux regulator
MPAEPPIACSLSTSEMPKRLAEMRAVGNESLLDVETAGGCAVLSFAASTETGQRLSAIVAAEQECCAFLTMRLLNKHDTITLTIDAPAGAEPVLADLVAAFAGTA